MYNIYKGKFYCVWHRNLLRSLLVYYSEFSPVKESWFTQFFNFVKYNGKFIIKFIIKEKPSAIYIIISKHVLNLLTTNAPII